MTPEKICAGVCEWSHISMLDMAGPSRLVRVSWARGELIWLLREHTTMTLRDIGNLLGGRDSSTISEAYQKVAARRAVDDDYADQLERLRRFVEEFDLKPVLKPALSRARRLISSGDLLAHEDAVQCGLAMLAACSILSSPELTADEARRAALKVMAGDEPTKTTRKDQGKEDVG